MYVQGNNRYVSRTHSLNAFLSLPRSRLVSHAEARPKFSVNKSIRDEASPSQNNLVALTIPTMGDPVVVFFSILWLSHNLVYTDTMCAPKRIALVLEPHIFTLDSEERL